MKTKIIYISGSELFSMTDIRTAFEEVRGALGFDSKTVLFGVPVDSDDIKIIESKKTEVIIKEIIQTPIIESEKTEIIVKEIVKAPIIEREIKEITPQENQSERVIIPILSLLGRKTEPVQEPTPQPVIKSTEIKNADTVLENPKVIILEANNIEIEKVEIVLEAHQDSHDDIDEEMTELKETVADIENSSEYTFGDEKPVEITKRTLQELLENMTPLREDTIDNYTEDYDLDLMDEEDDELIEAKQEEFEYEEADEFTTLEELASEFAEKQDEIEIESKNDSGGKIGKLKNILPFKKAKREDTGLMDNLFGWAGIAANDEEFTMPGFFTNSALKKAPKL